MVCSLHNKHLLSSWGKVSLCIKLHFNPEDLRRVILFLVSPPRNSRCKKFFFFFFFILLPSYCYYSDSSTPPSFSLPLPLSLFLSLSVTLNSRWVCVCLALWHSMLIDTSLAVSHRHIPHISHVCCRVHSEKSSWRNECQTPHPFITEFLTEAPCFCLRGTDRPLLNLFYFLKPIS